MAIKAYGPHIGSQRFSGAQGIGVTAVRVDDGWVGFVGAAGDEGAILATELGGGNPKLGYAFQAIGGTVNIAFSCAMPGTEESIKGFSANAIYWTADVAVAPGTITFINNQLFTYVRLKFVANAELHIVTR